jgi:hypothetical protein
MAGSFAPAPGIADDLRRLAALLEEEWGKLPSPDANSRHESPSFYRRKVEGTRWRLTITAVVKAGELFLRAVQSGAFSDDTALDLLLRQWDYPDAQKRNQATFMAVCEHWLPSRRPGFKLGQHDPSVLLPVGPPPAFGYPHAMRLIADEIAKATPETSLVDKPKRRRRPTTATKPLTEIQAEVVQIVGECKGNVAEAARRRGRDRKTVDEEYKAALKKLGKSVVKATTQPLPKDRRGQENITDGDNRRNI